MNGAAFDKPQAVLPEEEDDNVSLSTGEGVVATGNENRGMVLPFEPHSITFDDIRYSVDMPAVS